MKGLLNVVPVEKAAELIITQMRARSIVVFNPKIYYYLNSILRLLPVHIQMLITDFIDTGIDIQYDNYD